MSWLLGRRPKRVGFQLAPLVDLLLIVVFAQFLEVRETATKDQARVDETIREAQQRDEATKIQIQNLSQQLTASESLRQQQSQRMRDAFGMIASAFEIDPATENQIRRWVGDQNADLAPEVTRLAEEVSGASSEEVVRFLIGHAELLKRAEIWNLHVTDDRRILLAAGSEIQSIRLEMAGQDARADEAEDRLFAAYKQFPQPKGLVVILVSYSPRSVAGVYQPLINAVPKAVERMRFDLPGTRFEFTVLGATPLPDVLRAGGAGGNPFTASQPTEVP